LTLFHRNRSGEARRPDHHREEDRGKRNERGKEISFISSSPKWMTRDPGRSGHIDGGGVVKKKKRMTFRDRGKKGLARGRNPKGSG